MRACVCCACVCVRVCDEQLSSPLYTEFSYDDMDEEAWSDSEEEGGRGEGNFDVSKMFAAADEV